MRQFVPGSCAPQHLHAVKAPARDMNRHRPSAEYWCGSLYVVGQNGVLTILRCSEGTYDLVQLPGDVYTSVGATYRLPRRSLLASYQKGVHYAELNAFRLRVWALTTGLGDEGLLGWTLVHDANLELHIHGMLERNSRTTPRPGTEWEMVRSSKSNSFFKQENATIDGINDEEVEEQQHTDVDGENNGMNQEQENEADHGLEYYSWSSDEDNFIEADNNATNNKASLKGISYCGIIGLHPHKDVLLLNISGTAVAYHLATSRMQHLRCGLHSDPAGQSCAIQEAFPYRPCYDDMLSMRKIPCPPNILSRWKRKDSTNS